MSNTAHVRIKYLIELIAKSTNKKDIKKLEETVRKLINRHNCNHKWKTMGGVMLVETKCTKCGLTEFT